MKNIIKTSLLLFLCNEVAIAQVPLQFNYQGRLTDSNGIPVFGVSTGTFNIYKGGTVMGDGTNVFSETWTNLQTDANGVFSVTIGSVSNMPLTALADGTTSNRYIEVVINGQTNLPRVQIVAVPFAVVAQTVQGPNLFVRTSTGAVGMGTTNPQANLHISDTNFYGAQFRLENKSPDGRMYSLQSYGNSGIFRIRDDTLGVEADRLVIHTNGQVDVLGSISTAAGQAFKVRYGTGSFAASTSSGGFVLSNPFSFGYTFSAPPVVIVSSTSDSNGDQYALNVRAVTTSGFAVTARNSSTGSIPGPVTFNWVAFGL